MSLQSLKNLLHPTATSAVLYLARKAEGLEHFVNFFESYQRYPAGVQHDIIIIFKGFDNGDGLEEALDCFSDVDGWFVVISDDGFDLDAYRYASKLLTNEYIFCLNTFSLICGSGWLQKMLDNISQPGVGIVGATGSYESNQSSTIFFQKAWWYYIHSLHRSINRPAYKKYLGPMLGNQEPAPQEMTLPMLFCGRRLKAMRIIKMVCAKLADKISYDEWWNRMRNDVVIFSELCKFPPFPNPHIRTNAFMIRRDLYIAATNIDIHDKLDVSRLESGSDGITNKLARQGLKSLIVGLNGHGYGIEQWAESGTFRGNAQNNLLVSDNRTRDFDDSSEAWKITTSWLTWGDKAVILPKDFPQLGTTLKS